MQESADVRIAQYESGTRTPKDKVIQSLAYALDVSPQTLDVPNIDNYEGLMHTLFALEDIYNLKIDKREGRVCLTLDHFDSKTSQTLLDMFRLWQKEAEKLHDGEITEEEYNKWRYTYPQIEVERTKVRRDASRTTKPEE